MRINWTLLCSQAEPNLDGSYNLLGVTEELKSYSVPLAIEQLDVVLSAKVISPQTLHVWIVWRWAKNNQIIFHSDPTAHPITKPGSGEPFYCIVPIHVQSLTLPEYGLYMLDVLKNDQIIHTSLFHLRPG